MRFVLLFFEVENVSLFAKLNFHSISSFQRTVSILLIEIQKINDLFFSLVTAVAHIIIENFNQTTNDSL